MNTGKRAVIMIGALAALLPFGATAPRAAVLDPTVAMVGTATPIDWAIDLAVQLRTQGGSLTSAEARIAREQLKIQFLSLSPAARDQVVAAAQKLTNEEGVLATMKALNVAVQADARGALATQQAELASARNAEIAKGLQPKLGPTDTDLVFVGTQGPCRVADSRFWVGPLGGGGAMQVYVFSDFAGYNFNVQGGTGVAGSGNCTGDVFANPPVYPLYVVATVAVVNTFSTGSMRAWNGGTTLTVGGILGWNAGDVLSNTTVIPIDRGIAPYPGSGFKRDIGLFNNSGLGVDFIVDVIGYFVHNKATPLDCVTISGTSTSIPANSTVFVNSPSCPAGYTTMISSTSLGDARYTSTLFAGSCRLGNLAGFAQTGSCDAFCCRIPGN